MSDPVYSIEIIDGGNVSLGVMCDDCQTKAEALNWTYFYLGRYRSDAAKLYRLDNDGNPTELLAEIKPPTYLAERDRRYDEEGLNLPTRAFREKHRL